LHLCNCIPQSGKPSVPPETIRCIGWNQRSLEAPNGDFPNCVILHAWTESPQEGTSYFLSFNGPNVLDDEASSFPVAHLTTDQANSGTVILISCAGTNVVCYKIFTATHIILMLRSVR